MSTQVHNYSFSNIGRMFARQNVPSVYGLQKNASGAEAEETAGVVDSVSLSPYAPKPLAADLFRDAVAAGRDISSGGGLSGDQLARLREDRVFTAVSALSLLGDDGEGATVPRDWPGGIPAPTAEELEAARRRLAQRLRFDDSSDRSVDALQRERIALLEKIGGRFFGGRPVSEAASLATDVGSGG